MSSSTVKVICRWRKDVRITNITLKPPVVGFWILKMLIKNFNFDLNRSQCNSRFWMKSVTFVLCDFFFGSRTVWRRLALWDSVSSHRNNHENVFTFANHFTTQKVSADLLKQMQSSIRETYSSLCFNYHRVHRIHILSLKATFQGHCKALITR